MPKTQAKTQVQACRRGFYMHLELGVSWAPREDSSESRHQAARASRSLCERPPRAPQRRSPSRTSHLTQPAPSSERQCQRDRGWTVPHSQGTRTARARRRGHHQPTSLDQQCPAAVMRHLALLQPQPQQLPSDDNHAVGSEHRSSSRGRSASSSPYRGWPGPTPLSDTPWDAEPEPMAATALPRRTAPAARAARSQRIPPSTSRRSGLAKLEDGPAEDRVTGVERDMQSLAVALLTVDNGFEDQWWYQGSRFATGELLSPPDVEAALDPGAEVGWPVADGDRAVGFPLQSIRVESADSSVADIVSPMTDFSSPGR